MNPAARKAVIAQAEWDVAQMHEIEKRQRERARIHALADRERPEDESEPGVQVTYRPKAKGRAAGRQQRTERFHTEKAGAWWLNVQQRIAGENE